jgi:flagellar protein FliS
VLTASPGQLVLMLYDGALKAIAIAQAAFERPEEDFRRLEIINEQILKAQAIIRELQSGLNFDVGGEFAQTMSRLYDYHHRRLFEANLRKQIEPLIEVEPLIRAIRNAWAEMLSKQDGPSAPERVRGIA